MTFFQNTKLLYTNATKETKSAFGFFKMLTLQTRNNVLVGQDNIMTIDSEELKELCTIYNNEEDTMFQFCEKMGVTPGWLKRKGYL